MGAISDLLIEFTEAVYPGDFDKQQTLSVAIMAAPPAAPFTIYDPEKDDLVGDDYDSPYEATENVAFLQGIRRIEPSVTGLQVRNASGEQWQPPTLESYRQEYEKSGVATISLAEICKLLGKS